MDTDAANDDSMIIEFFDMNGVACTTSNVGLTLSSAGTAGTVEVSVDDGPTATETAAPNRIVPLSTPAAHKIQVSVPLPNTTRVYWESLSYGE